MNIASFLLIIFLFFACTGAPKVHNLRYPAKSNNRMNEQKKVSYPIKDTTKFNEKLRQPKIKVNDTTFILRNTGPNYYHAIYIDETANPRFKKSKKQARVTNVLQQKIKESTENKVKDIQKKNMNLPQFWIPLYQYKSEFYLYDPCDGINDYSYFLSKEVLSLLYYDGPSNYLISTSKKINDQHYIFEFKDSDRSDKLDIYIIDKTKKLAVFKFTDGEEIEYDIFTSSTTLNHFDVIVNDCKWQKEFEYHFETPDYEALIKGIE